jgi:hypothetical protein
VNQYFETSVPNNCVKEELWEPQMGTNNFVLGMLKGTQTRGFFFSFVFLLDFFGGALGTLTVSCVGTDFKMCRAKKKRI